MRKIEWTNRAKKEFDNTFNFWINHNKSDSYSEKLLDETLRKISIAENPFVGEVVHPEFKKSFGA
jgi:plasmid stabilization system protein ParE